AGLRPAPLCLLPVRRRAPPVRGQPPLPHRGAADRGERAQPVPPRTGRPGAVPARHGTDAAARTRTGDAPGARGRAEVTAAPGEEQTDHVRVVAEQGRICALATHCARDLQDRAAAHPELFSAKPFDATLFNAVSLANAFGSPDDPHTALRIANRTSLWIFALDWLIDYRAKKREDVEALVARCTAAVTDGTPDGDGQDGEGAALARFLVEIRDLLATAPAFAAHRDVWLDELRRMLEAMALEWEWKASRAETGAWTPTLDDYLANADNFGSTFVNAGHWIFTSGPAALDHLDPLLEASREV